MDVGSKLWIFFLPTSSTSDLGDPSAIDPHDHRPGDPPHA
jgi:hypothetical protein